MFRLGGTICKYCLAKYQARIFTILSSRWDICRQVQLGTSVRMHLVLQMSRVVRSESCKSHGTWFFLSHIFQQIFLFFLANFCSTGGTMWHWPRRVIRKSPKGWGRRSRLYHSSDNVSNVANKWWFCKRCYYYLISTEWEKKNIWLKFVIYAVLLCLNFFSLVINAFFQAY